MFYGRSNQQILIENGCSGDLEDKAIGFSKKMFF
jgi:hypothetical protein